MFAIATLMALVQQVSGTPYISGGDTAAGTDCSGLASWVSNVATGRPAFGDRFSTGNQENALLARGFQYGTQPGALVIGWNSGHTAVTLPDGTPVSSGETGGVKIGGGGAYQSQFTHHMYLPVANETPAEAQPEAPLPFDAPPPPPIDPMAAPAPIDPFAPPPPADPMAAPIDPMAAPEFDPFAPPPAADPMAPVDPMADPAPIMLDVPPPPAPPAPEDPAGIAV